MTLTDTHQANKTLSLIHDIPTNKKFEQRYDMVRGKKGQDRINIITLQLHITHKE